ncbi:VacJ family lipoprotein [Altererythrobacter sp. MF3-039]|uniref:MlaA family lipoprotein n=1 Tax=Altererythrobacter sp. MF3-039 TaxID=3252901 RepID=UPI00390C821C
MVASNLAIAVALLGAPAAPDADVRVESGAELSHAARRVTMVHVDTHTQQLTQSVESQPDETTVETAVDDDGEENRDLPQDPAETVQQVATEESDTDPPEGAVGPDGEILVTAELEAPEGDPAEALNAATYEVVEAIDLALVEPLATAYDDGVPKPVRRGIRNFLRNLGEPINFLNFLLQLKPGKALKTAGRFVVNTTLGVGGLFNPAEKKFGLRYEQNGLANTLGYYGIGPGPYLYLPFIGSTTVRDLAGRIVDLSIIPAVAGKPFNDPLYTIPVASLNALEWRIETDDQIDAIRSRCNDPYSANRDIYLIQRQLEIDALRGKQSENLAELVERFEFNCDIDVLTSGEFAPDNAKEFVDNNTNLVEAAEEEEAFQAELDRRAQEAANASTSEEGDDRPEPDPATSGDVMIDEAAASGPAPQPEPEIRFVSEPQVQPVS